MPHCHRYSKNYDFYKSWIWLGSKIDTLPSWSWYSPENVWNVCSNFIEIIRQTGKMKRIITLMCSCILHSIMLKGRSTKFSTLWGVGTYIFWTAFYVGICQKINSGALVHIIDFQKKKTKFATLVEMSISDKISCHKAHLYFLMCNDPYFHVVYAPKINSGSTHKIKFPKTKFS